MSEISMNSLSSLLRLVAVISALAAVASCGLTYVSSRVSSMDDELDVRVIPMSSETILLANIQRYVPQGLPGAFFQTAGAGGVPRGAGTFPDAPDVPQEPEGSAELRLPPPVEPDAYRLGAGDVVRLSIASNALPDPVTGATATETSAQEYALRDDGAISIPQVGTVDLAGLTIEEAETALFQRLIDAGIDPNFSIEVAAFNSRRIAVGGAVREAQVLSLGLTPPDLGQALAAAGGLTVADTAFATIRLYRDGALYQIPLTAFLDRGDLQSLPLTAGDAIYVDTTYDLDRALEFYQSQINVIAARRADRTAALSELQTEVALRRAELSEERDVFTQREELGANQRDYVYLAGEVANQTRWPLPYGQQASLADVLYENGGFQNETGNPAHIYVLRTSTDPAEFGAVTAWHLDARNAAAFTLAPRFEMRPNDIVFIEEQPITRWNRAIQQSIPSLITSVGAATRN
jgi:polysaccharide biosynthesis/export protein